MANIVPPEPSGYDIVATKVMVALGEMTTSSSGPVRPASGQLWPRAT